MATLRRKKVLASINKSKIELANQPLPNAKRFLFGEDFPAIASKEAELSRGLAINLASAPKLDKAKPSYGPRYSTSSNNSNVFPKSGKYQNFRQRQKFFRPPRFHSLSSSNNGPCGLRNCYRSKHSFSLCSSSNVSTSDKNTSGVISNFRAGSSKPASKGGGSLYTRRFYSRLFLAPKKDGSMRPIVDLSPPNRFIETPHFQIEHLTTVQSKLDLKDAYLSVAIHPQSQKYLRFLWQKKAYQFRALPFGLNIAPSVFTRLMKPVAGFLRKRGTRLVLYLDDIYAHHRIDPSGDPSVHPDGNGSPRVVGVRNKQGEVDTNPLSVNYIPGVYDQFDENALHAPSRESAEITDAMSSDSLRLGSTASNPSPVIGTARVLPPSGLESTSSFSSLTSPPNQGSGRIELQLHNTGSINSSSQRGTDLVAPELSQSQWQPDYSSHARPHNFHRRLLNRLGGCLWQQSDQWEMVSHREMVTYKCSRTERCYAGNTVPYEESALEDNIPEHGQLNCSY